LPKEKLDGRDISSWLLKDPPSGPDDGRYFYYLNTHLQAVREGKWKLVLPRPQYPPWLNGGLRSPDRPHVGPADTIEIKEPLLFDLASDIGEHTDVAAQHPEVVASLTKIAEAARADLGDYNRIGAGQRFFDPGPKRSDAAQWINGGRGEKQGRPEKKMKRKKAAQESNAEQQ